MKRKVILTMCLLVAVMTAWAQKVNVTGQVTDEQGEPLIGVTVKVLGATTGSVTDFEGNYSVSVDKGSSLEFSYIGYKPITVKAGSDNVDIVYGPSDNPHLLILNLGHRRQVNAILTIRNTRGKVVYKKVFKDITLPAGRTVSDAGIISRPTLSDGFYFFEYQIWEDKR